MKMLALGGLTAVLFCAPHAHAALVAHYGFEEGAGETAIDAAGADDNGTLTNGATRVAGRVGSYALSLDGVDDFVNLGDNQNMLQGKSAVTSAMWAYFPSSVGSRARLVGISKGVAPQQRYSFEYLALSPSVEHGLGASAASNDGIGGNGTNTAANAVPLDTWVHVANVIDIANETNSIYVNGTRVGFASGGLWTENSFPNTASLAADLGTINHGVNGMFLKALLDDVRIYDNALTQSQIQALVPEPSAGALVGGALMALSLRRRRRWLASAAR